MDALEKLKAHLLGPPKVSQKAFADQIGVSQGTISKLVTGIQPMPPDEAIPALQLVLGTTFEDWLRSARRRKGKKAA